MKNILKCMIAAGAALALATPANAFPIVCGGTASITHLGQNDDGYVLVASNFGTFWLCSVSISTNGILPEDCKGWLTQLLTARGLDRNVTFHFDGLHPTNAGMTAPYCTSANFNWQLRVPFLIEVDL